MDIPTTITGALAVIAVPVLAWVGNRIHTRVDGVEDDVAKCVTREELSNTINSMRTENAHAHAKVAERLDQIWRHLAAGKDRQAS